MNPRADGKLIGKTSGRTLFLQRNADQGHAIVTVVFLDNLSLFSK